ncbi:MAG: hypothetical protein WBG54_24320 [Acidobacteriaceae bacterium]
MRKTTVFGYNMEKQASRRRLVAVVYAVLALSMAGCWFIDRLHVSSFYLYFFVLFFVNQKIFGGYGVQGLVKPFTGKGPRNAPMPSNLVELQLRLTGALPTPDPNPYRNDERELMRRDRAHYQAYQGIAVLLAFMWFLASWDLHPPRFIPPGLLPILLYCIALPAVLLAITLPQAIILWTEPDLAPDREEEAHSAVQA